jgi:DNA-binding NtrC family response regulator
LRRRNVNTFEARNSQEAFDVLKKEAIDVVVLDVRMPGMDGMQALRVIKKTYPLVEVIMLTGHANVEVAIEGMELGAFDYLMKPMDTDELLYKIQDAYKKKLLQQKKLSDSEN